MIHVWPVKGNNACQRAYVRNLLVKALWQTIKCVLSDVSCVPIASSQNKMKSSLKVIINIITDAKVLTVSAGCRANATGAPP